MEKFSLKWNDFQANVSKCFRLLMSEDELCDVTLVTDDQKKVSAHKLVLSACSEYFKNIFKGNKQAAHPFLCLEGISSDDLSNMLDYIYNGELQIYQGDVDRFLKVAQRFKLEGLIAMEGKNHFQEESNEKLFEETTTVDVPENCSFNNLNCQENTVVVKDTLKEYENEQRMQDSYKRNDIDGTFTCLLCPKTTENQCRMKEHLESHFDDLVFPCKLCDKTFRLGGSLRQHMRRTHRN